jgi:hypothetical protein
MIEFSHFSMTCREKMDFVSENIPQAAHVEDRMKGGISQTKTHRRLMQSGTD